MTRLLLILTAAVALLGTRAESAEPARPNVLFIVIDNADFEHFGKCYDGKALTPNIDRIAERGVTFSRAYAVTPLCVPSRYTCLTGRYASRCHGVQNADADADEEAGGGLSIEKDLPNLPKVMKQSGYATGFVGKYHLENSKYPRYPGEATNVFDPKADAWLKERNAWLTGRIKERGFDYTFHAQDFRTSQFHGIDFEDAGHNMEADVLGAMNFIDQNKDRPFFLYLATRLIHLRIDPKLLLKDYEKYGRVTEGGLLPEAPKVPMAPRKQIYDEAMQAGEKDSQLLGMHWLDTGIGAVIKQLEDTKLLDNTLVIFFSDNNMRGKETLYEGGARVPLLMMWQGKLKAGSHCDRIVANTDFAPTIFDACKITPPKEMTLDGRSMLPVLQGGKDVAWRDGLLLENGTTKAVVTDEWKYVALRYPPDVQAKIDEVDRTGEYPKLSPKAGQFFEKFKTTLTPEQWKFARNSWRWHTQGNNYMKSIDDFPFQFDADQLFKVELGTEAQDRKNLASDPQYADLLAQMKQKMRDVTAPLDTSFGEFKQVESKSVSSKEDADAKKKKRRIK